MSDDTEHRSLKFYLPPGVVLFDTVPEEIRFRKGIWNHTEAVVRLYDQTETVRAFFRTCADELRREGVADVAAVGEKLALADSDLEAFGAVLDDLRTQGFLTTQPDGIAIAINAILGGVSPIAQYESRLRPVLFVTDSEYAMGVGKSISRDASLPLDVLDHEIYNLLCRSDLTQKTDAIDHLEVLDTCRRSINPYACVVLCLVAPRVAMLRNLNRILVALNKPFVLSLIDGPFLVLLSAAPTQTGCFECFEQRVLARLEDTVVYQQFVASQDAGVRGAPEAKGQTPHALTAHMLVSAALSEGFLFSAMGVSRLAGRCVSVYLPMLEIQVGDLLRVPYCSACGFVAASQIDEMYTSSRALVANLLKNVDRRE